MVQSRTTFSPHSTMYFDEILYFRRINFLLHSIKYILTILVIYIRIYSNFSLLHKVHLNTKKVYSCFRLLSCIVYDTINYRNLYHFKNRDLNKFVFPLILKNLYNDFSRYVCDYSSSFTWESYIGWYQYAEIFLILVV